MKTVIWNFCVISVLLCSEPFRQHKKISNNLIIMITIVLVLSFVDSILCYLYPPSSTCWKSDFYGSQSFEYKQRAGKNTPIGISPFFVICKTEEIIFTSDVLLKLNKYLRQRGLRKAAKISHL